MGRKKNMSGRAREELVTGIVLRYAKAGKKEKGAILDEAVKDTGYNRKYLISKLGGRRSPEQRRALTEGKRSGPTGRGMENAESEEGRRNTMRRSGPPLPPSGKCSI